MNAHQIKAGGNDAMNEVRPTTGADAARALVREHPERMRQEQAAANTMIAAAAQLGRWDELELAVDIKIAEQQEFVAVWDERVRSKGGDARNVPDRKFRTEKLTVLELQGLTGVNAVQASRWRTSTATTASTNIASASSTPQCWPLTSRRAPTTAPKEPAPMNGTRRRILSKRRGSSSVRSILIQRRIPSRRNGSKRRRFLPNGMTG